MYIVSINKVDINRQTLRSLFKNEIDFLQFIEKIDFLRHHLNKSQGKVIVLNKITREVEATFPMSVRGNLLYAWRRQTRVDQITNGVIRLTEVEGNRTNAFITTFTYTTPHYNPPQTDIAQLRRKLKQKGVHKGIISIECHASGAIHYHGVFFADTMYEFYGHKGKDGKTKYRCNSMRTIFERCWGRGQIDVQAITKPDGAGRYVMKEIGKYARVDSAVEKYKAGEVLSKGDIQRVHLFHWAIENKRSTLSVSRGMIEIEDKVVKSDTDLIKLKNGATKRRSDIIVLAVDNATLEHLCDHPPPNCPHYGSMNRKDTQALFDYAEKVQALHNRAGEIEKYERQTGFVHTFKNKKGG